jgi:hypothetical protein
MASKVGDFRRPVLDCYLTGNRTLLGGLSTQTIASGASFPCGRPGWVICNSSSQIERYHEQGAEQPQRPRELLPIHTCPAM